MKQNKLRQEICRRIQQQEPEIDRFIKTHRTQMIENVCKLVRIPSVAVEDDSPHQYGEQCARALEFCRQLAEENGLSTQMYGDYGVEISLAKRQDRKRLLFAAHADVVAASEGNLYEPFGAAIVGDYIVGRGVVDNKAPLMAVLYALIYCKQKQLPLKMDVQLFCGSHEETDMEDFLYYLGRAGQPDFGLAVDDDFPITNGEKGILQFELQAESEAGTELLEQLREDTQGKKLGLFGAFQQYGTTLCRLKNSQEGRYRFDCRIPPSIRIADAEKTVRDFASKNGLSVQILRAEDGYYIDAGTGIPHLLTRLYNEVTGTQEQPYVMQGCTYARHFRNGCGFGAGNPQEKKLFPQGHGAAHGPDEAQNIDVFLHAVKMYILAILAIDDYWSRL